MKKRKTEDISVRMKKGIKVVTGSWSDEEFVLGEEDEAELVGEEDKEEDEEEDEKDKEEEEGEEDEEDEIEEDEEVEEEEEDEEEEDEEDDNEIENSSCRKGANLKPKCKFSITGEDGLYSCEKCGKRFVRMDSLQAHQRVHAGSRPFECPADGCNASYSRSQHLKRHIEDVHMKKPEKFKCEVSGCLASFESYEKLTQHFNRAHYAGNPASSRSKVRCSVPGCKENFPSLTQMRKHRKEVHKKIKCAECPRLFEFESNLRIHEETHKYSKKYIRSQPKTCRTCDLQVENWDALLDHRNTDQHRKNQRTALTCPICMLSFLTQSNYNAHKVTHEKERPVYRCTTDGCDKFYYHRKNLNYHIKVSHERDISKMPTCSICDKDFCSNTKLANHMKIIHAPGYVRTCIRKPKSSNVLRAKIIKSLEGKKINDVLKINKRGTRKKRILGIEAPSSLDSTIKADFDLNDSKNSTCASAAPVAETQEKSQK